MWGDGGVTPLSHQSIIFSSAVKSPPPSSSFPRPPREGLPPPYQLYAADNFYLTGNFEGRRPKQRLSTRCKEKHFFLKVTCTSLTDRITCLLYFVVFHLIEFCYPSGRRQFTFSCSAFSPFAKFQFVDNDDENVNNNISGERQHPLVEVTEMQTRRT